MVDALRSIHRALISDGVLLDIHPEPLNSQIEVWQQDTIHRLGEIDQSDDHFEIKDARERLQALERDGLFVSDQTRYFELLEHHSSVESWTARWEHEDYRLVATPEMFEEARALLSAGGELVIREPVRAMRLLKNRNSQLVGPTVVGVPWSP